MKKVRYAFYIARFDLLNVIRGKRKPHLIDDGISLWTGLFNWFTPRYSHWEGWIARVDGSFGFPGTLVGHPKQIYHGTCYTSTMRGDDNGTVSRPASTVFKYPNRWEFIEFEVTDGSFEEAKAWADERVKNNKGYSMKDIRRFFMPLPVLKFFKWDDPERDICSEFGEGWSIRLAKYCNTIPELAYSVAIGLWYLLLKILIRSPRRLWRDLVRRHHVPTYSLATGLMVRNEKGKKVKA